MRILLGLMLFASISCGGSDSVLHFSGRDETEANFRSRIRDLQADNAAAWVKTCAALNGKTPQEAAALLISDAPIVAVSGATPKPGQKADAADLVRAGEIVLEECKR